MKKFGFCIHKTNVGPQKIDGNKLKIFSMIIAFFLLENKDGRSRFFEETFQLVDINTFFTLSNVEINFTDWKLR